MSKFSEAVMLKGEPPKALPTLWDVWVDSLSIARPQIKVCDNTCAAAVRGERENAKAMQTYLISKSVFRSK